MLNAIILAGDQPIRNSSNTQNKATLVINEKMMIDYVIDAVKSSEHVDRIVVVGPRKELAEALKDKVEAVIEPAGSIMKNLIAGAEYVGNEHFLLVCSCDIPMITSDAINDFVSRSELFEADLGYPIVEKSVNIKKYPEAERTYVRLKEGRFTGGNVFYINPAILEKGMILADKLLAARKNPLKMASLLGISFLLQLITGTLSISKVEKLFSGILDINAHAIISSYAEIGNDVDKPSDVIVAAAHLSQ